MNDANLQHIKGCIQEGNWLELLTDPQLLKVHAMLKKGTTNSEIIRTCQTIFGVKPRASLQDLLSDLVKFRTKVLDDKSLLRLEEAQGNKAALELSSRLRGLTSKVDAFGRLNWLVDKQTERVLRLLDIEAKTIPMEATTDNINMLEKMLHNLRKAQQELNIDENEVVITAENKEKLAGLVTGFQASGDVMLQATKKLLELAEDRAMVLTVDESGTYKVVSETKEEVEEKETVKLKI